MSASRSPWTLPPDPLTRAEVRALWLAHAQHVDTDRAVTAAWAEEIGAGAGFDPAGVDVWADTVDASQLTPRSPVPFPVFRPELLPARIQAEAKALVKRRGPGLLVPLCGPTGTPWNTLQPDSLVVLWGKKDPPWADHVRMPGSPRYMRGAPAPALHDPPTGQDVVLVVEGLRNALAARHLAAQWDVGTSLRSTRVVGLCSMLDLPAWVTHLGQPTRFLVVQSRDGFRVTERTEALQTATEAMSALAPVLVLDWARLATAAGTITEPHDLADVARARGATMAAHALGATLTAQWEAA